jgi:hypothetical protein
VKHRLTLFLAACALALLTACAAIGVEPPKTFNERLAVAVSTVTAARDATTTLLVAGKISAADARNLQAQADVAREGLDVARALAGTDPGGAMTRLEMTQAALRALNAYLLTKQGAKP